MFKRKRDRSYFFHLFIQISLLLVIMIIAASYLLYDRISGATYKTINSMNEKIVSQISYNFDYMDNFITTFVMNQSHSPGVNYLMNAAPADFDNPVVLLKTFKEVNDIYTSTPFVDSIYVYNAKAEKFAIIGRNNGLRHKDSFADQEILTYIYNESAPSLTPIARVIPASISLPTSQSKVYSYLYVDRGSAEYPNAVVVNVDANWLLQNMNAMRDRQESPDEFFMIVNEEGVIYGDGDNRLFLNNAGQQEYIQRVIRSPDRNGYFQLELEGKPFILTYSKLDNLPLNFISGIPLEKVVEFKADLRTFTIVLALLILLLGIAASYYVSKSMLSPLKILEKKMRGLFASGDTRRQIKNEIRFMSTTLTEVSEQMSQLQSFKSDHMAILKNEFLHNWLIDPSKSEQPILGSQLQFYTINLHEGEHYRLLLFRIDGFAKYQEGRPSGAWDQNRVDMIQTVTEHFQHASSCEAIDMKKDHFVIILGTEQESTEGLDGKLRTLLNVLQTNYGVSLSVIISRTVERLSDMSTVYHDCLLASEYRMIMGHACVMRESEIQQLPNQLEYEFPETELKALLRQLFVNLDLEETKAQHDLIFTIHRQFTPANIRFAASYLLIMLLEKVKTIELTRKMDFGYDFVHMNHTLSACETLDEIERFFLEFYHDAIGQLKRQQDGKNDDLVCKLKDYINNQYKDANLSVASLSDLLKLSPDYLRKTFKQHTGDSIQNYINDVRLTKAAEQLINTNKVIEDIIRNVSIENTKYFFTLFKAKYGVTPAEYRLNHRKQHLTQAMDESS